MSLRFDDITAGGALSLPGDLRVTTALLNHPDGATAYRVEHRGLAACYVTDVEHTPGALDPAEIALIHRADLVIYRCTYEHRELDAHRGWGHSTWQQGVRPGRAAGARRLAISHHDPDRRYDWLDDLARRARAIWRDAIVARGATSHPALVARRWRARPRLTARGRNASTPRRGEAPARCGA
ncbi:MAG: MBL fold metallo-hydrolase [Polyangiales bacterium]